MSKVMKQFRLDEATVQNLERIATAMGKTQTEIVEEALGQMADPSISKRIDAVFKMIGSQISDLEIIREYGPRELTEAECIFLEWLNKSWDTIRDLPGFWEPRFKENEEGDNYILDNAGQPIVDDEHEKTRPIDM